MGENAESYARDHPWEMMERRLNKKLDKIGREIAELKMKKEGV